MKNRIIVFISGWVMLISAIILLIFTVTGVYKAETFIILLVLFVGISNLTVAHYLRAKEKQRK